MLMAGFFKWWYGAGWKLVWQRLGERIRSVASAFSVTLLIRTLFSPWRRVIASRGRGFDAAIHAAIDNAVGRFIGFSVRCVVLVAATISTIAIGIIGGALFLVWPFLPICAVALLVMGVLR